MDLTYGEVGATRHEPLPSGYGHVRRDVRIGHGRPLFEAASADLLGWRMHRRAGFTVTSAGDDVTLTLGRWPLRLTIPCRVVYRIDEENRRGFAYGTRPGHPERGEEAFVVELTETGDVYFRIRAFSRPASLLARAGGPITRMVQEFATDCYVRSLTPAPAPLK
ncbi:DUF1990 domain-containing protein [Actinoplanes sp. NPDC049596]|uniref:DUF1990 family protein n=1 Tax=unclassified Actinoplanes TaxID=2626549 RepID=UPI00343F5FDE